jgi:hypothetical protein
MHLVALSVIGITCGALFAGWNLIWGALTPLFALVLPLQYLLLAGTWVIAGPLAGLIIKRRGAALAGELIAASVSFLLASQWSIDALFSGAVQGLGAELVFAIFGYRLIQADDVIEANREIWDIKLRDGLAALQVERERVTPLTLDKPYLQLLAFTLSALSIIGTLERDPLAATFVALLPADIEAALSDANALTGVARSGNQAMFLGVLLIYAKGTDPFTICKADKKPTSLISPFATTSFNFSLTFYALETP